MFHVAVVLSGCGFLDGSEIHESVLALAALDRAKFRVTIAAPAVKFAVIDHSIGAPQKERRVALEEAARIARGKIVDLAKLSAGDFDALLMPGGYGAAKTLCDFESAGAKAVVHADLARLVLAMHAAKKPIAAICIAPAIVAAVLRDSGQSARLTLGGDPAMSKILREMGQEGVECAVDQCVVDTKHRIVSTPAYMYDARISEVAAGIDKLVAALLVLLTPQRASN